MRQCTMRYLRGRLIFMSDLLALRAWKVEWIPYVRYIDTPI
jgi:hypothetical protein